jgi:O-antigen/teichoic acid export membrane protein
MSIAYPPLTEPRPDHARRSDVQTPGSDVTQTTLRSWGPKFTISLLDQGLTAGVGFLVNLLLARWLRADAYGAFAVAFASYLFIAGFHNVLLLEPISVMGPLHHAHNLQRYFRTQLTIHTIVTGVLSLLALITAGVTWLVTPQSPLCGAMFGIGIALPFLLLLWLARRMCYVVQLPALALEGSIFYLAFVAAGLFLLARLTVLSPFAAFLLTGLGSLLGAGLLLRRLGIWTHSDLHSPAVSWSGVFRENWVYGRWLLGSTVLSFANGQIQTFIVAAVVGLGAAGTLRAMQLPSVLMAQTIVAASLLILPSLAYDFGRADLQSTRNKAYGMSTLLGVTAALYAALLFGFSSPVEKLLYGGRYFDSARLIPMLALMNVGTGLASGFSLLLRAMRKTHVEFAAYGLAALVSLTSAYFLARRWGIAGAAISMVLGSSTLAIFTYLFCWSTGSAAGRLEEI